jgi:hypothetical protein
LSSITDNMRSFRDTTTDTIIQYRVPHVNISIFACVAHFLLCSRTEEAQRDAGKPASSVPPCVQSSCSRQTCTLNVDATRDSNGAECAVLCFINPSSNSANFPFEQLATYVPAQELILERRTDTHRLALQNNKKKGRLLRHNMSHPGP